MRDSPRTKLGLNYGGAQGRARARPCRFPHSVRPSVYVRRGHKYRVAVVVAHRLIVFRPIGMFLAAAVRNTSRRVSRYSSAEALSVPTNLASPSSTQKISPVAGAHQDRTTGVSPEICELRPVCGGRKRTPSPYSPHVTILICPAPLRRNVVKAPLWLADKTRVVLRQAWTLLSVGRKFARQCRLAIS